MSLIEKLIVAIALPFCSIGTTIDQNCAQETMRLASVFELHQFHPEKLSKGATVMHVDKDLTIYNLIPKEAHQTWQLDLFDLTRAIEPHFHELQNQLIFIMEGQLTLHLNNQMVTLLAGQYGVIPSNCIHDTIPGKEGCRFLALDMPGYDFPEDVFFDQLPSLEKTIEPKEIASPFFIDQSLTLKPDVQEKLDQFFPLDPVYYQAVIDKQDFAAYSLIPPDATEKRWSLALIEIRKAHPRHFHLIGTERFVVLNGELLIEIDGKDYHLTAGQSARVSPGTVHYLRAHGSQPVRLLCVNHPAFNPNDFYLCDKHECSSPHKE